MFVLFNLQSSTRSADRISDVMMRVGEMVRCMRCEMGGCICMIHMVEHACHALRVVRVVRCVALCAWRCVALRVVRV